MAPYSFDAPDTDTILRSSDGKELCVHRLILSHASPVFQDMFRQPTPKIVTIDVPESSDILQPFLQYLYPRSPPKISDLPMWEALYTIADKYRVEAVMDPLRDMLIHRFLETSSLRVYALASHWGFEEEAKIAITRTLTIDIKDISREDAELMGGAAYRQLYLVHSNRQEAARDVINYPSPSSFRLQPSSCSCIPPDYADLVLRICALLPDLLPEEACSEAATFYHPISCRHRQCRNSPKNVQLGFASVMKQLSELPD